MYISHSAHAYHDKWSNLIGRIVTRDRMAAVWLVDEYVLILCKLVNMIFWRHKYIARNAALSVDLVYTFCKFIIFNTQFYAPSREMHVSIYISTGMFQRFFTYFPLSDTKFTTVVFSSSFFARTFSTEVFLFLCHQLTCDSFYRSVSIDFSLFFLF